VNERRWLPLPRLLLRFTATVTAEGILVEGGWAVGADQTAVRRRLLPLLTLAAAQKAHLSSEERTPRVVVEVFSDGTQTLGIFSAGDGPSAAVAPLLTSVAERLAAA
jgi:hypothetical protein